MWETEDAAQRRDADAFAKNADDSPEDWRWKQAMGKLPPVGPAASTFFDLTSQDQADSWQQALSAPASLSGGQRQLPPSLPAPPTPSPTAPPQRGPRDWMSAIGGALGAAGEAIGGGLGAIGEQLEE